MMRKIISLLFLVGLNLTSYAVDFQQGSSVIKGKVTDLNGSPLAGTSITIVGNKEGLFTDSNGQYEFKSLKDGTYTLSFSFIGYETKVSEVVLKGTFYLNIVLSEKLFLTDEVFVNATRAGKHAPLAYSTVGKEQLKKQNSGPDLPYLLSLTPSLVETSEAGNGVGYTSLRIRGSDGSRINVTIDGIPLNDPESQQVFWVDLPDLASSVENIQVQRGAGTSTNGSGAFGATINIQTINAGKEPFAEIGTSLGSFNTIKNVVSVGSGIIANKFSMQMRYSDIKSDGYIERTGSKHRSAFISGSYRNNRSNLKANIILGEENTGIGWWGVPEEMLAVNRRYNPAGEYSDEAGIIHHYNNESDNYVQNHFQLIYNLKITNALTLNTALHYTMGRGYYEEFREDQTLANYNIQPINLGDSTISETDLIRRKWLSNDFYGVVYSLKYQRDRIDAVAGGSANLYLGDHYGNIIWMRNSGTTEKDHQWYFNNSRKGEFSLYGKINYSLSDKSTAFGDIQYRRILYIMKGIDDDLKDLSQEHKFGFFNPKAGLFFSITPNQDAYISFSVANREPSRADFKEASGDLSATPGNETLYDTELGYSMRKGRSNFGLNLYAMIYKDQLVPTGELSNVGYSIMTNVDNSHRLGLEFSSAIELSDKLFWNFNLTLSRNKIRNYTEYYVNYNTSDWSEEYQNKNLGLVDIAYSPSVISSSDILFKVSRGLEMHLISKYVGSQYFDNTMNPERAIDPYFVNNIRVDLSPEIRNIKGLDFQFLLNNILNEKYESNAYGGNWYEDGVEQTWAYYFPQAGINFMIKAALRF